MSIDRKKLRNQITDAAGNILYTFSAHWNIINRLKKQYKEIKIMQIILTALSTGGFLASLIAGIPWLSWIGGLTSAIALGLNLYMLNFNVQEDIRKHTEAANELWDIREAYKSLLVDFDGLSDESIRNKRDELTASVGKVNKAYPGTDEKSFAKAQAEIAKYTFDEGEAEKLLNTKGNALRGKRKINKA